MTTNGTNLGEKEMQTDKKDATDAYHGRQEIRTPPHADQLEHAMATELDTFLAKQSALANRRSEELAATLARLKAAQDVAQRRASIALRAYAHATVVIRQETERVGEVVQELEEGMISVDDAAKQRLS